MLLKWNTLDSNQSEISNEISNNNKKWLKVSQIISEALNYNYKIRTKKTIGRNKHKSSSSIHNQSLHHIITITNKDLNEESKSKEMVSA